jgi:hypothetical protein
MGWHLSRQAQGQRVGLCGQSRDHGFDSASAKDLQARLKPLIRKTQPYAKKIAHRGTWVEPAARLQAPRPADPAAAQVLAHACPCCGGRMIIIETFDGGCHPRYRPTAMRIDTS